MGQKFAIWEFGLGTHEYGAVMELARPRQLGIGVSVVFTVEAEPPLAMMQRWLPR